MMTRGGGGQPPQTVLVIDDAQDTHDLVDVRLRAEGIRILHALDPDSGLAMARGSAVDLVLVDFDLPERSGLDVCHELQADPKLAGVPVIFLTGTADVESKVKAFDAGAVDYVTKPFDAVELRARVRAALRTKRYLDLLATRAQLDGLTGLWNRAYFDTRLAEDVAAAARYKRNLALVLLDIDHFKRLNDSGGHPFGDLVLRKVAEAIAANLRPGDVACRYGGDEFGIVLQEAGTDAALAASQRIRSCIEALDLSVPTPGGAMGPPPGSGLRVTATLGCASTDRLPDPAAFSPQELLAAADDALYDAKRRGRNRVSNVVRPVSRITPAGTVNLVASDPGKKR